MDSRRHVSCADRSADSVELGPDLQNILRQSYDYLTIIPKLRSTYDGRLIYKTSYYTEWKAFHNKIHVQNRNIVSNSVRKLV